MLEREVNGFTRGLHAGEALDPIHQSRIEDDIGAIYGRSTCTFHGDCLYTHLVCINLKVLSAGTQHLLSPRELTRRGVTQNAAARADSSGPIGPQGARTAEAALPSPTARSASSRASGASPLSSRSAPTSSPRGGTRGSGRGRTSERLDCGPASWSTARSAPAAVARRNSAPSGSVGAPRRPCAPPRPCD